MYVWCVFVLHMKSKLSALINFDDAVNLADEPEAGQKSHST